MAQTDVKVVISLEDRISGKMPNMTKSFIKAGLALDVIRGAARAVGKELVAIGQAGAKFQRLEDTLAVVARNMEISTDTIKEWKTELGEANLFGAAATEAILKFTQSGIANSVSMKEWTLVAKDFAASIGISSLEGVNKLTDAVVTLNPELLKQFRLSINLTDVYGDLADATGRNISQLTFQEKQTALLNRIIEEHGKTVAGVYTETYDGADKAISSVKDTTQALRDEMGLFLEPAIKAVATTIRDILQPQVIWLQENQEQLRAKTDAFYQSIADLVSIFRNELKPAWDFFMAQVNDLKASLAELGITGEDITAVLKFAAKVIVGVVVGALKTLIFTAGLVVKALDLIIQRLSWIKDLKTITIDIVEKVRRTFSGSGDKRAVGGLVTPSKAFMVGERGPELFVPPTTGRIIPAEKSAAAAQGGGGNIELNVHVGMYAGSETEKRNIAEELYKALVNIANTRNSTVAEVFGG